ncbi:META domain-containing protein [Pseudomonas sp. RIT-PI-AD]|uniref:META domain-containing protein n=1 Tax=Pseudomonas sp. RIT-PI-AD TaxID=3035294 RepID=UPI0021D96112|nr:META domain-containing protein [Pseudomonas sp. RIT-PI-AD]
MKPWLPLTASLLALGGCASEPENVLERETAYQVEWIGERPLVERSHLTLNLGEDGRAYGNAGCNHWFAPYTLENDSLRFGQTGSTRKLCSPAVMEQEQRFLDALGQIQRWDVSPLGQLRLWPAHGKPIRLLPEQG